MSLTLACWPLPALEDGRTPEVSSAFGELRDSRSRPGTKVAHSGMDVTYRARAGDPPAQRNAAGRVVYTPNRTKNYYSPDGVPVLAAASGVVVQAHADRGAINGDVWIHHPQLELVTRYAHLSRVAVSVGDELAAGQAMGTWGAGDNTPFIHLHFEALRAGVHNSQFNPAPLFRGVPALSWPGGALPPGDGDGQPGPLPGGGGGLLVAALAAGVFLLR